jgi:Uma2 family endonuclease
MMRKMTTAEFLSGAETLARRELVWGIVREPPSPFRRHQGVVTQTTVLLANHVLDERCGKVYVSPLDVVFDRDQALVLQPDVMYVSNDRRAILGDIVEGSPDLVVEVLSAGGQRYDRVSKLQWYRQYHVREYWIIDPDAGEIEVIDLEADPVARRTFREGEAVCSKVLPRFSCQAADFFAS